MLSIKSRFLRVARPKKFGYTPRYYSESKEKISKLMKKYADDDTLNSPEAKMRMDFRDKIAESSRRQKALSDSSGRILRLLVLLAGICFICYILIKRMNLWEYF